MAKEMMIIFVYDTETPKEERDDISNSLLYFHPHWVPGEQKFALCGQLVGTMQCLKSMFRCPSIISLQSGKFSVREFGRFILAVGTDRNIADWVVEYRTDTLCNLITFFHNDLDVMHQQYQEKSKFIGKLYHIFETYLRILTYGGNMFSNIPTIQLPKSASNVFLEAIQILQCCQEMDYVLGGTMLYHNKVVASQLSSNLTKRLVLTDPYRIKSPAEIAVVDYQLPLGVQLLQVYIDREDYQDLLEDSTKCRTVFQYLNKKSVSKKTMPKATPTKETVMTAMKRDQSIIFSTVPEEDSDHQLPINIENKVITAKPQNRPKFLNLRSKTTDFKPENKSEFNTVPSTPFHGQTSICSTPMTDLSKVIHEKVMSICLNLETATEAKEEHPETDLFGAESASSTKSILDDVKNKLEQIQANPKKNAVMPYTIFGDELSSYKKCYSTSDLREDIRKNVDFPKFSSTPNASPTKTKMNKVFKTITDPTYPVFKADGSVISESLYEFYVNKHVTNLNNALDNYSDKLKSFEKAFEDEPVVSKDFKYDNFQNKISCTDEPWENNSSDISMKDQFPKDNLQNKSISKNNFQNDSSDNSFQKTNSENNLQNNNSQNNDSQNNHSQNNLQLNNFQNNNSQNNISQDNSIAQDAISFQNKSSLQDNSSSQYNLSQNTFISSEVKRIRKEDDKDIEDPIEILLMSKVPERKMSNQETRKSLSLPLKSLTNDSEVSSPGFRKFGGGVQLTPLISKLSMIASEDRSSGFCSRVTTPSEYKDYIFTPTANYSFLNSKLNQANKESKYRTKVAEKLHRAVLFICGQQDMVVTVLMEEQGCSSPDVINKLWETCTEYLGKLERQLRQCLEMYPGGNSSQAETGEPYSYLCMDPQWDTVQRGGPWGGIELGALTHLHRDFNNTGNLTEIILRDDESIIYGHHCGKTEVFYHQCISSNAGLPPPADPMGVVPLKAKRRLERDHSIILL